MPEKGDIEMLGYTKTFLNSNKMKREFEEVAQEYIPFIDKAEQYYQKEGVLPEMERMTFQLSHSGQIVGVCSYPHGGGTYVAVALTRDQKEEDSYFIQCHIGLSGLKMRTWKKEKEDCADVFYRYANGEVEILDVKDEVDYLWERRKTNKVAGFQPKFLSKKL